MTLAEHKLALLGFGNVGQALARLLLNKCDELKARYGVTFRVTAIRTETHGAAIDPAGVDLVKALELSEAGASLDTLSAQPAPVDALDWIAASGADALFENTPVSYMDGEPALSHLRTALKHGMHAITANKGPVVHGYEELKALAEKHGRAFRFESTVMDGAPVFGLARETLPAGNIHAVSGVLNSTTNLILTRMEDGEALDDAVAYAQSIGIAETDPSGDIDGWDAAVKLAALSTVIMGVPLKPDTVERKGIRGFTRDDITTAKMQNKRWKLVCRATLTGDGVDATVAPEMVGVDSPFYVVNGTTSIVQFESDVLGKLSLIEENPGPMTTAYGLLADWLNALGVQA
jgi:homoserine dehydrogenase